MRILAVDDEKFALEGLVETIRKEYPLEEVFGFRYAEDALADARKRRFDVAFLDIEMADKNGVWLALQLKELSPEINIIFVTGYGSYRGDAFDMHASGYIVKPVTAEKVKHEMENLRRPVVFRKRIKLQTFGNFEVYLNNDPLVFRYAKTKELLAYLVDRQGALCTVREMLAVLFEDDGDHATYFKSLRSDLLKTLESHNCEDILIRRYGMLGIVPQAVECDYYDFLREDPAGLKAYRGEYMAQYSWAEITHAALEKRAKLQNGESKPASGKPMQ